MRAAIRLDAPYIAADVMATRRIRSRGRMESPPNDLDAHALGYAAPGKGLAREACPYAEGTEARVLWLSGYDEAVSAGADPVTGGVAKHPVGPGR